MGDGSFAVYHVTDYQAAKVQTMLEVKNQIEQQLKAQIASNMASQEGQQEIAALQQGALTLKFANPENVTLLGQSEKIGANAVKQIFGTSIAKLPAYTGSIDNSGNFVIYKINSEATDPKLDKQNIEIVKQLATSDSTIVFGAYMGSLRSKYEVNYKTDRLNLQSK